MSAVRALSSIFLDSERPKESIESLGPWPDKRERAFMMELVYGVLRHRDTLDWVLDRFLKQPGRIGPMTRNNLRTALYQLLYLRTPQWAVVNEAVEIEKAVFEYGAVGMPTVANAVLRNIIRQKDDFELPFKLNDPVTSISVNTSHPRWMVKRWIKRFGREEAERLAYSNNEKPPFAIRANRLRTSRDKLLSMIHEKGITARPAAFAPEGIIIEGNVTHEDLSFARGLFTVQDEASQLVSRLLGPKPGERVLDACAAPGGKTTHIAELMGDSGEVMAVDKDPKRLRRLRDNVTNLGTQSIKIVNADISGLSGHGLFGRILLDAPCSATGVIRRNPDVKYRHKASDLAGFRERQSALLRSVAGLLERDGVLGYSVCSIEPEEGEQVIEEFLKTERDFRIIDAGTSVPAEVVKDGFLRTFPHRHNMDGFFGAILCRKD